MYYKLFNEDGDFLDKTTEEPKNLLWCNVAWTPEGTNVGWDFFDTLEQAMDHFNLKEKPKPIEKEQL
jgi:hypothetical protein